MSTPLSRAFAKTMAIIAVYTVILGIPITLVYYFGWMGFFTLLGLLVFTLIFSYQLGEEEKVGFTEEDE